MAALNESFRNAKDAITDWSGPFGQVMDTVFEPEIAKQFDSEGERLLDEPWVPLAESTQASRKKKGVDPDHPILEVTGLLKRSFEKDNSLNVREIAPTEAAWGSAVPYSLFHQTGTQKGLRAGLRRGSSLTRLGEFAHISVLPFNQIMDSFGEGMPARQIIVMDEPLGVKVKKVFTKSVYDALRSAHFKTLADEEFVEGSASEPENLEDNEAGFFI